MNKNWLESYISKHKEDFYLEPVPPQLWDQIDQKMSDQKVRNLRTYVPFLMQIAASVTIILCIGIGIGYYFGDKNSVIQNPEITEFLKSEPYYQQLVGNKMASIQELSQAKSIKEEIDQLDARYQELKYELLNNPNADQALLIQSLNQNFQIRISLLEKFIQVKSSKNEDDQDHISI